MRQKKGNDDNNNSPSESSLNSPDDETHNKNNVEKMVVDEPKQPFMDEMSIYKLIHKDKCEDAK